MIRATKNLVMKRSALDSILTALSGTPPAAALLDGCKLKLFENDFNPTPGMVVADFTESTAVGYAAKTIAAWSGPGNPDNDHRGLFSTQTFVFGDNMPNGKAVKGYYITDSAGTTLYGAERFAQDVLLTDPGDVLTINVCVAIPETFSVNQ